MGQYKAVFKYNTLITKEAIEQIGEAIMIVEADNITEACEVACKKYANYFNLLGFNEKEHILYIPYRIK